MRIYDEDGREVGRLGREAVERYDWEGHAEEKGLVRTVIGLITSLLAWLLFVVSPALFALAVSYLFHTKLLATIATVYFCLLSIPVATVVLFLASSPIALLAELESFMDSRGHGYGHGKGKWKWTNQLRDDVGGVVIYVPIALLTFVLWFTSGMLCPVGRSVIGTIASKILGLF